MTLSAPLLPAGLAREDLIWLNQTNRNLPPGRSKQSSLSTWVYCWWAFPLVSPRSLCQISRQRWGEARGKDFFFFTKRWQVMQMCFHFNPEFSNHWTGTWSTLASQWNVNMMATLLGWSFNNQHVYFGQGSHSLGLQLWSLACHRIHLCHHLGQPMIANDCKCRRFHPILANQHLSSWPPTKPTPSLLLPWPDWDESEGMEECDQRGDKTNKFLSLWETDDISEETRGRPWEHGNWRCLARKEAQPKERRAKVKA